MVKKASGSGGREGRWWGEGLGMEYWHLRELKSVSIWKSGPTQGASD